MSLNLENYAKLIVIFSVIGVLDTAYLSYHYIIKTAPTCSIFSKDWCKKVFFSSYNKTLGIPNAFAGLLAYILLIVLAILFINKIVPFYFVIALVMIGFAASMYFLYLQSMVIRAFCFWCVISAVNFILLFLAIYFIQK